MDKLELKNIAVEQGLDFDGVIELVFDAQQAKVEELQKRLENLEKLKDVYRALSDKELDNCTEGLLKHIERLEMLEQALKGEG